VVIKNIAFKDVHVILYIMNTNTPKEITATSFRKDLFKVLKNTSHSSPTRIRYKKGCSIILSEEEYRRLKGLKNNKAGKSLKKLEPLASGKILKSLGKDSDKELLAYMRMK